MKSFKALKICRKLIKYIFFLLIFFFKICCILFIVFCLKLWFLSNSDIKNPVFTNGDLKVIMIDVGQGDSFLLLQDDKAMLIDAGKLDFNNEALHVLKEYGVKKLDYAIITHPHIDHAGGFIGIMFHYKIDHLITTKINVTGISNDSVFFYFWNIFLKTEQIICNNFSYAKNNGKFSDFLFARSTVKFLAPIDDYYEVFNNYSLVMKISYKNKKILFTGDIQTEVENELLDSGVDLSADVYKAAHHGSFTSNNASFMEAVNPKYVLVSSRDGSRNFYGHPVKRFVTYLKKHNILLYRTDEQGTVEMTTNGEEIYFNKEPGDYKSGKEFLEEK